MYDLYGRAKNQTITEVQELLLYNPPKISLRVDRAKEPQINLITLHL